MNLLRPRKRKSIFYGWCCRCCYRRIFICLLRPLFYYTLNTLWHLFSLFFYFSEKGHVKYFISAKVLLLRRGFSLSIHFQNMSNIFFFIFDILLDEIVYDVYTNIKRSFCKLFFRSLLLVKLIFCIVACAGCHRHVHNMKLSAFFRYGCCWYESNVLQIFLNKKEWRRWNKEKIMA